MMRALSTRISIAPAERLRTASASSSSCSPIAPRRPPCRPISSACGSRPWLYVLVDTLRRVGLRHSQFADAAVATIRRKLLKLGAQVRTTRLSLPAARLQLRLINRPVDSTGVTFQHIDARSDGLALRVIDGRHTRVPRTSSGRQSAGAHTPPDRLLPAAFTMRIRRRMRHPG